MQFFVAEGVDDEEAWGLLPPVLPDGSPIAAAALLDTADFAEVPLVFPVSRPGRRMPLTFFYWQAFAATPAGRAAVERQRPAGVWFRPARSSEGDELLVVRAPRVRGAVDPGASRLTWHPVYPPRHPLAHLSGAIRTAGRL